MAKIVSFITWWCIRILYTMLSISHCSITKSIFCLYWQGERLAIFELLIRHYFIDELAKSCEWRPLLSRMMMNRSRRLRSLLFENFFATLKSFNSNDDWGETHPQTRCLINDSQMLWRTYASQKNSGCIIILMMACFAKMLYK